MELHTLGPLWSLAYIYQPIAVQIREQPARPQPLPFLASSQTQNKVNILRNQMFKPEHEIVQKTLRHGILTMDTAQDSDEHRVPAPVPSGQSIWILALPSRVTGMMIS